MRHMDSEMNFVDDQLANMSLTHPLGPVYFEQALSSYKLLLVSDIFEISRPHDIIL